MVILSAPVAHERLRDDRCACSHCSARVGVRRSRNNATRPLERNECRKERCDRIMIWEEAVCHVVTPRTLGAEISGTVN